MSDEQPEQPPLGVQVVITADAEVIRSGQPAQDDNDSPDDEEQQ